MKLYWAFVATLSLGLSFDSCEELIESEEKSIWAETQAKVNYFLFKSNGNESFIYFTDPHLLGANSVFSDAVKINLSNSFTSMNELYSSIPFSFCLCGGDWLNNGDTQEMAKSKLLYVNDLMKSSFRYYKMMGNHDTNYQGIISTEDSSRGDLPKCFIDEEYFSETGSAYYSFHTSQTVFYVLDSGLDWSIDLDDYRFEQLSWLASSLEKESYKHIVLCIHMFYNLDIMTPMSAELVRLCNAFNDRCCVRLNEQEYDFRESTGRIHFVLTGHNHNDYVNYVGHGIPVICTCDFRKDSTFNFDLCVLDYESGFFHMIRVGGGEDRSIRIAG